MKTIKIASKLIVALLVIFVSACEKDATQNPAEQSNSFTIKMTDAPADFEALQVEIDRVEAYLEGSGWVVLSNESQLVSVLELTNGTSIDIASQSGLEAGLYTAIALYIGDDNTLVVDQNGSQVSFDLEGGHSIEFDIHEQLSATSHAEVLLDFNVATSIIQSESGEFFLNPEITTVVDAEAGVQGQLSLPLDAVVMLQNESGEIIYSAFTNANGAFLISGVAEGSYELVVQFQGQAQGIAGLQLPGLPTEPVEINIHNVTVVQGEITQMGTIEI
ncbi:MAG: DUF4382 domain-containing protein [Bacteroidia bacterium]